MRSDGQGVGGVPEEHGDYEDHESAHQASAAECDDAGDEHGDDEGGSDIPVTSTGPLQGLHHAVAHDGFLSPIADASLGYWKK